MFLPEGPVASVALDRSSDEGMPGVERRLLARPERDASRAAVPVLELVDDPLRASQSIGSTRTPLLAARLTM